MTPPTHLRLHFIIKDTPPPFGCTHGIRKFLRQGLNPCHSSDLSHSSDNPEY